MLKPGEAKCSPPAAMPSAPAAQGAPPPERSSSPPRAAPPDLATTEPTVRYLPLILKCFETVQGSQEYYANWVTRTFLKWLVI